MSGCTDKRFEKMLFAYELGLLSDEDRAAVELHHLECEYCFNKTKNLSESARLLRADRQVREVMHQLAEEKEADQQVKAPRYQLTWLKTALATAAVLILLIIQPWNIEISPRKEAIAAENLLVILNFQNLGDQQDTGRLGEIISNLLMTDLSESQHIHVASNQRLFDILKMLGEEESKRFDQNLARRVAEKCRARWFITGDILQTTPVYIITSQIVEVATGNIVSSQKVTGEAGMTIFSLADSLSKQIRNDLPLPSEVANEPDPNIAAVTTNSLDAYRCYLEGVDYFNKYYYIEAVERFEKALEYDSTFAMAYYYLSNLKDSRLIYKASEYAGNVTRMEKYYIESKLAANSGNVTEAIDLLEKLIEHYPGEKRAQYLIGCYEYSLGNYDKAIEFLGNSVELDPLFGDAYNLLGYAYAKLGNFDKAIEMNDKFVFLSPNEPNPYDSRGDIYVIDKQYDEAIKSYKKALEKKHDFYSSWENLGIVYSYLSDFVRAESCFQVIAAVEDIYVWTNGKVLLGHNLIYQGKFEEALAMLATGSQEDKKAHGEEIYATYHHLAALIYEELGDYERALNELDKANEIMERVNKSNKIYWRRNKVRMIAGSGNIAKAEIIADSLKAALEEAKQPLTDYWYASGSVEMAKGNNDKAEKYFKKAVEAADDFDYGSSYMLGLALFNMDLFDESIKQFERLLKAQDSIPGDWLYWDARIYYYLGRAYESSGDLSNAVKQYDRYLDIRKNADVNIDSVIDARNRLAKLIS